MTENFWYQILLLAVCIPFVLGDCRRTPNLAHCRRRHQFVGRQSPKTQSATKRNGCNYPNLWLIPGKADETCKRPGRPNVMKIYTKTVNVNPKVIKIPGCFTIDFEIETYRLPARMPTSFFAKTEYQWWNFPEFEKLKCQNSSADGCGGFGNNCFYCDICNSLHEINRTIPTDISPVQAEFAEQFRAIECPDRPTRRHLIRRFCFNDWRVFDRDGDCKFDFLPDDYKSALKTIGQVGYGTMIAKFKLSHNATAQQLEKKDKKEKEIESVVKTELRHRKRNWDRRRGQFESFQDWYIQYRKDSWHRDKYLPWLIYTNEIACLKLTFDVCDKNPNLSNRRPNSRGRFGDYVQQCS